MCVWEGTSCILMTLYCPALLEYLVQLSGGCILSCTSSFSRSTVLGCSPLDRDDLDTSLKNLSHGTAEKYRIARILYGPWRKGKSLYSDPWSGVWVPCRTSAVSCFSCYASGSHLNFRVANGFESHLIGSEVGLAFGVFGAVF